MPLGDVGGVAGVLAAVRRGLVALLLKVVRHERLAAAAGLVAAADELDRAVPLVHVEQRDPGRGLRRRLRARAEV